VTVSYPRNFAASSSAVVAAIGTGFKQGRDFAAWLSLVPKQESTGDRTKLGRISKRGNAYLRTLFVLAAHVVLGDGPPPQCALSGRGATRLRMALGLSKPDPDA
jgi:transposase